MPQRLLARPTSDAPLCPIEPDQLEKHLDAGLLVWLDVTTEDTVELDALGQRFGFDPAAIEDIVDIEQLPKADHYDDYLFVVLHALATENGASVAEVSGSGAKGSSSTGSSTRGSSTRGSSTRGSSTRGSSTREDRVDTREVDCFVRPQLFVTVRASHVTGIDWLWDAVQNYAHLTEHGADDLFAQLTEVIGRRYLEVIDHMEARIDELTEDAIEAEPQVLAEIQTLRREDATIRKVLRPQRTMISNLRHYSHPVIGDSAKRILLDSFDVHNQVVESLASARGLLTDTLDTYRGAAAERHANAATLLTVYSAILLPLTLITGWYGMNVNGLPAAERTRGWQWVTALMLAIAVVSWFWFVRVGLVRIPKLNRGRSISRGLASAAKAPVRPFTMLRGSAPTEQDPE